MNNKGVIYYSYIIIIIIAIVVIIMYTNYRKTGHWTLFPKKLTPAEKKKLEMERELKRLEKKLKSLERQESLAFEDLVEPEKKQILEKIEELKQNIKKYDKMIKKMYTPSPTMSY